MSNASHACTRQAKEARGSSTHVVARTHTHVYGAGWGNNAGVVYRSYLYRKNPYKENVCLTMAFKVYFRMTTSGRIFSYVLPCDYSLITYVGKTKKPLIF